LIICISIAQANVPQLVCDIFGIIISPATIVSITVIWSFSEYVPAGHNFISVHVYQLFFSILYINTGLVEYVLVSIAGVYVIWYNQLAGTATIHWLGTNGCHFALLYFHCTLITIFSSTSVNTQFSNETSATT
jgi:hypothetical protein